MATRIEITERTKSVKTAQEHITERTDWQERKQDTRMGQEIVMKVTSAAP